MSDDFLARFADVECCDIVTTGRRTGRRHEIEIWFGVLDDTMYLIAGNGPTADWFRNMQADPVVTVQARRRAARGRRPRRRPIPTSASASAT